MTVISTVMKSIFTLSLIFHNHAKTEKLKPTNMFAIVNNAHKAIIFHDRMNFFPNKTKAISGHNAIKNIAKKNANTEK
jgi:hypothetical protein